MQINGHNKIYLSRSQTRSMSAYEPIGDAHGGAAYGERNDPVTAAVSVGANLLGASMQADAASEAADQQARSAANALGLTKQQFDLVNQQQAAGRGLGYQGYNQIRSMLPGQYTQYDEQGNPTGTATGQDYLTHQFNAKDFAEGIDPGYAFRLQQGQMANQRAANVGGGALSGNTLQGLNDYNQGAASQEYGNTFNRYQTQRGNIYNTLASIAGLGQAAQGQTNAASSAYGTNAANLMTGSAAAQAAGTVGVANAYGGALSNAGNTYALSNLLGNRNQGVNFTDSGGWSNGGSGVVNVPGQGTTTIGNYFTPA